MKKRTKKLPTGMGSGRSRAHAFVWKSDGTWCYSATDSDNKIVLQDNGADFPEIFRDAFSAVSALRRIENAGHRLVRSYAFLVDKADVDF